MTPDEPQAWQDFTNNGMVLPENPDNRTVSGNPETDSKTSLSGLTDTL